MRDSGTLKTAKLASVVVLILGTLLAAMMILTESEPGAIPLALILLGQGQIARPLSILYCALGAIMIALDASVLPRQAAPQGHEAR